MAIREDPSNLADYLAAIAQRTIEALPGSTPPAYWKSLRLNLEKKWGGEVGMAALMTDAMVQQMAVDGLGWARLPASGDLLHQAMTEAARSCGKETFRDLSSEDVAVRLSASRKIATTMADYLARARIAVLRRHV